jgi:hypothetical protein
MGADGITLQSSCPAVSSGVPGKPLPNIDPAKAFTALLKKGAQIVSFGEIHNESCTQDGSLPLFVATVLPAMAPNGYKDLVLEFLGDSPQVEAELTYFMSPGGFLNETDTPILCRLVEIGRAHV